MFRKASILSIVSIFGGAITAAEPATLVPLQIETKILQAQSVEPAPAGIAPPAEASPWIYGRADFLIWWYNTPNPAPILNTGNPLNDQNAGILGGPSTRTLYGNRDLDLSPFYGTRLTFGYWEPQRKFGLEAGVFFLGQQTNTFTASADATGNPFLAVPFFSSGAGIENRFLVANPGGLDNQVNQTIGLGSFVATFQSQLLGAEINAMANLQTTDRRRIDVFAGFAYRGLYENLKLEYNLPETGGGIDFGGEEEQPIVTPSIGGNAFDQFSTRNNFYGGQIGTRTTWDFGRFSFDFSGKLGIGATVQQVTINGGSRFTSTTAGSFQQPAAVVNQSNPFGVFAQRSNIGRYTQTAFALVPEFTTQLNLRATERLKFFVGYNFMYWNNVVRPGDQIDRTINRVNPGDTSLFITSLQSDAPAVPNRPAPTLKTTDLLVQGINLGFELQY